MTNDVFGEIRQSLERYISLRDADRKKECLEYIGYALAHEDEWEIYESVFPSLIHISCPHPLRFYGDMRWRIEKHHTISDTERRMMFDAYRENLIATRDRLTEELK